MAINTCELHEYGFYLTSMPPSRPADYHLGCCEDCVFLDFNRTARSQIYLVRISLDGYGCYDLSGYSTPMTIDDSKIFLEQVNANAIDQLVMARILRSTLSSNIELLCLNALQEYNLV